MIDVEMPQMGESIVEGTLTKWLKKPGDKVERDEPLFEISTDKVDTEIPSPVAGTLAEILVEEGKTVGINTVVGRISDGAASSPSGSAAPAATTAPAAVASPAPAPQATVAQSDGASHIDAAPQAAPAPVAAQDTGTVVEETAGPLSPLVRKMARENNIDLSRVKGTGVGGRITKQDLEAFLNGQTGTAVAPVSAPRPVPAPPPQQAPVHVPAPAPEPARQAAPPPAPAPTQVAMPGAPPAMRVEPMTIMRQKIAEHMTFSKHTSAHVTTVHKVDMTKVAKLRDKLKGSFQAQYGFGLTFLPFMVRAACAALRQYPLVNASIEGTNIIYHRDINLGIAVALENGLIVPVIRNADEKNIVGLQRSIVDLATRARSRQLRPDEVTGGTFSITNFGSFGSIFATPVINQPQVAILGIGAVQKEPVVIEDAIAIRSTAYLALTFDHRLIDGALGDQFTAKVKSILENWSEEVM
ncbi:MAG TPA: 2-oxoglutarate dehydrogenase, E2 component, dihydrolipoamide succinyltransferase [Bryobacteraceae bacterium]|jgi:2-oxoglutarate dehydrogenase E2 component (dihydrolipoamide succinyltransferase)|nr:2-oxoglutarate dehydrogenase, E2 component, dihydrolipoamide succinyltransferase [Bryobacteraceae bacterium]